jgi:hypothetical protein
MDEAENVAEAQRLAEPLGRRAAAAFWQLDGPNARLMRAGKL